MQYGRSILGFVNESRDLDKAVYLVTGCQAEPGSALGISGKEVSKGLPVFGRQNMLVYSSRCIPGNEKALAKNIRTLRPVFERIIINQGDVEQIGLKGLDIEERLTHVSCHAYGGDIRKVLEVLRSKKVLPWPQISPQIEAFR
jgi:ribonuclease J